MNHHLKKRKRWQNIKSIVVTIAKMKVQQCIDEANAADAPALWHQMALEQNIYLDQRWQIHWFNSEMHL